MKTFTITFNLKQLFIGAFSGVAIISMLAFTNSSLLVETIDKETAHTYYSSYASANEGSVTYLSITGEQYQALRALKKSGTPGYRIYFGQNGENKVSMICRIDAEGNDDISEIEYVTSTSLFRGCPTACDNESWIVTGE